jgi:uncharacterized protein YciI
MLSQGSTPHEDALVGQHFAYLQSLLEAGILILAGRTLTTDEDSFGIIIFNAESDEAAQAVVDDDPALKAGVFKAKLYPYRVALIAEENI